MNDYTKNLIKYVMHHGGKTEEQAIRYLDENCAGWRLGEPPKANIPPKKVPYFKPGKELKDLINREPEPTPAPTVPPAVPSGSDLAGV